MIKRLLIFIVSCSLGALAQTPSMSLAASCSTRTLCPSTNRQPLWVHFHGSGGSPASWGDLWNLSGDASMGATSGVVTELAIYQDGSSCPCEYGVPVFRATPHDKIPASDGATLVETYWYGMRANLGSGLAAYPWTSARINYYQTWLKSQYNVDTDKIYCSGKSMGGGGLREMLKLGACTALVGEVPVWEWYGDSTASIPGLQITDWQGTGSPVSASTLTVSGAGVAYGSDVDTAAWIAANCATLPPILYTAGRTDTTLGNAGGMWTQMTRVLSAIEGCRGMVVFNWNNGTHSTAPLMNDAGGLVAQYATAWSKSVSYPAFVNFSLDNNAGNGANGDGDCNSGTTKCWINKGWAWTVTTDAASTWTATISNAQITSGTATADITVRNAQAFVLAAGQSVNATINGTPAGSVTADANGLATALSVSLNSGSNTVSFSTGTPPPAQSVRKGGAWTGMFR